MYQYIIYQYIAIMISQLWYIYIYIHIHIYIYVYVYVCMFICTYVYMRCINISSINISRSWHRDYDIYIYIHVYIYIYIRIFICTYKHMRWPSRFFSCRIHHTKYMYSLLNFECHVFSFKSSSMLQLSQTRAVCEKLFSEKLFSQIFIHDLVVSN